MSLFKWASRSGAERSPHEQPQGVPNGATTPTTSGAATSSAASTSAAMTTHITSVFYNSLDNLLLESTKHREMTILRDAVHLTRVKAFPPADLFKTFVLACDVLHSAMQTSMPGGSSSGLGAVMGGAGGSAGGSSGASLVGGNASAISFSTVGGSAGSSSLRLLMLQSVTDIGKLAALNILPVNSQVVTTMCDLARRLGFKEQQQQTASSKFSKSSTVTPTTTTAISPSASTSVGLLHLPSLALPLPSSAPHAASPEVVSAVVLVEDHELIARLVQMNVSFLSACPLGNTALADLIGLLFGFYAGTPAGSIMEATCEAALSQRTQLVCETLRDYRDIADESLASPGSLGTSREASSLTAQLHAVAYFKDLCRMAAGKPPRWLKLVVCKRQRQQELSFTSVSSRDIQRSPSSVPLLTPSDEVLLGTVPHRMRIFILQCLVNFFEESAPIGMDISNTITLSSSPSVTRGTSTSASVGMQQQQQQGVNSLFAQCLAEDILSLALECPRALEEDREEKNNGSTDDGDSKNKNRSASVAASRHRAARAHRDTPDHKGYYSGNIRSPTSVNPWEDSIEQDKLAETLTGPQQQQHQCVASTVRRHAEHIFYLTQRLAILSVCKFPSATRSTTGVLLKHHCMIVRECREGVGSPDALAIVMHLWRRAIGNDILLWELLRSGVGDNRHHRCHHHQYSSGTHDDGDDVPLSVSTTTEANQAVAAVLSEAVMCLPPLAQLVHEAACLTADVLQCALDKQTRTEEESMRPRHEESAQVEAVEGARSSCGSSTHPCAPCASRLIAFITVFSQSFTRITDTAAARERSSHAQKKQQQQHVADMYGHRPDGSGIASFSSSSLVAQLRNVLVSLHPALLACSTLALQIVRDDEDDDDVVHNGLKSVSHWIRVCCLLGLREHTEAYLAIFTHALEMPIRAVRVVFTAKARDVEARRCRALAAGSMPLTATAAAAEGGSLEESFALNKWGANLASNMRRKLTATTSNSSQQQQQGKGNGGTSLQWSNTLGGSDSEIRSEAAEGLLLPSQYHHQHHAQRASSVASHAAATTATPPFSAMPYASVMSTQRIQSLLSITIRHLQQKLMLLKALVTIASTMGVELQEGGWALVAQGLAHTESLAVQLQVMFSWTVAHGAQQHQQQQELISDVAHMRDSLRLLGMTSALTLPSNICELFLSSLVQYSIEDSIKPLGEYVNQISSSSSSSSDDEGEEESQMKGRRALRQVYEEVGCLSQMKLMSECMCLAFIATATLPIPTTATATAAAAAAAAGAPPSSSTTAEGTARQQDRVARATYVWKLMRELHTRLMHPDQVRDWCTVLLNCPTALTYVVGVAERVGGTRGGASGMAVGAGLLMESTSRSNAGSSGGGAGAGSSPAWKGKELHELTEAFVEDVSVVAAYMYASPLVALTTNNASSITLTAPFCFTALAKQAASLLPSALTTLQEAAQAVGTKSDGTTAAVAAGMLVGGGEISQQRIAVKEIEEAAMREALDTLRSLPVALMRDMYAASAVFRDGIATTTTTARIRGKVSTEGEERATLEKDDKSKRSSGPVIVESSSILFCEGEGESEQQRNTSQEGEGETSGRSRRTTHATSMLRVETEKYAYDVSAILLKSVLQLVQSYGSTITGQSWEYLLLLLQHAADSLHASPASLSAAVLSDGEKDTPIDSFSTLPPPPLARRPYAAAATTTTTTTTIAATECINTAFRALEAIQHNCITSMDCAGLYRLIACAGAFVVYHATGSEDRRVHLNLSAVQMLWSIGDYIASGAFIAPSVGSSSSPTANLFASGSSRGGGGSSDASNNNNSSSQRDVLWCGLLLQLLEGCLDTRQEVRQSALKTLFSLVQNYGAQFTLDCWYCLLADVLAPLMDIVDEGVATCTEAAAAAALQSGGKKQQQQQQSLEWQASIGKGERPLCTSTTPPKSASSASSPTSAFLPIARKLYHHHLMDSTNTTTPLHSSIVAGGRGADSSEFAAHAYSGSSALQYDVDNEEDEHAHTRISDSIRRHRSISGLGTTSEQSPQPEQQQQKKKRTIGMAREVLLATLLKSPAQLDEVRVIIMDSASRVFLCHYNTVRQVATTAAAVSPSSPASNFSFPLGAASGARGSLSLLKLQDEVLLKLIHLCGESCLVMPGTSGEAAALCAVHALHGLLVELSASMAAAAAAASPSNVNNSSGGLKAATPGGGNALAPHLTHAVWTALELILLRDDRCRHTASKQCTAAVVSDIITAMCDDVCARRTWQQAGSGVGGGAAGASGASTEGTANSSVLANVNESKSSIASEGGRGGVSGLLSRFGFSASIAASMSPTTATTTAAAAPRSLSQEDSFHYATSELSYYQRLVHAMSAAATSTAVTESYYYPNKVQVTFLECVKAVWPLLTDVEAKGLIAELVVPLFPSMHAVERYVTQGVVARAEWQDKKSSGNYTKKKEGQAERREEAAAAAGVTVLSLKEVLPPGSHPSMLLLLVDLLNAMLSGANFPQPQRGEGASTQAMATSSAAAAAASSTCAEAVGNVVAPFAVQAAGTLLLLQYGTLGIPSARAAATAIGTFRIPESFYDQCYSLILAALWGYLLADGNAQQSQKDAQQQQHQAAVLARRRVAVSTLCSVFSHHLSMASMLVRTCATNISSSVASYAAGSEDENNRKKAMQARNAVVAVAAASLGEETAASTSLNPALGTLVRLVDCLGDVVAYLVEQCDDISSATDVLAALVVASAAEAPEMIQVTRRSVSILVRWSSKTYVRGGGGGNSSKKEANSAGYERAEDAEKAETQPTSREQSLLLSSGHSEDLSSAGAAAAAAAATSSSSRERFQEVARASMHARNRTIIEQYAAEPVNEGAAVLLLETLDTITNTYTEAAVAQRQQTKPRQMPEAALQTTREVLGDLLRLVSTCDARPMRTEEAVKREKDIRHGVARALAAVHGYCGM